METPQLLTDQIPPEMLLMSDDAEKKVPIHGNMPSSGDSNDSASKSPEEKTCNNPNIAPGSEVDTPGEMISNSKEEVPGEMSLGLEKVVDENISGVAVENPVLAAAPYSGESKESSEDLQKVSIIFVLLNFQSPDII